MKNIHVLPTNKPSSIGYDGVKNLHFVNDFIDDYQNIYITSDEALTNGNWCIDKYNQIWEVENHKLVAFDNNCIKRFSTDNVSGHECSKIILTTDQDLIKDGVQAIDNEFLEWFVKNPSCESVEIKPLLSNSGNVLFGYKIIIPKEKDYFPDTKIGSILSSEDIVKDITELENQSFEGWTTDSIKGYLLACKNIKEKLI